jgi:hypothetical protein
MFGLDAPVLGLITGAMGYIASARAADREHELKRLGIVAALKNQAIGVDTAAHDAASKRDDTDWGKAARRIIAFMVLGAVCLGPYLLTWTGATAYMRDEYESAEWLFGLIPSMKQITYTPLSGVVVNLSIVMDLAYMIGGYYFGSAAGRGK